MYSLEVYWCRNFQVKLKEGSLLQWRREVGFAGFDVPIQMDVSPEKMNFGVAGIDPQRRSELIKVCIFYRNIDVAYESMKRGSIR